VARIFGEPGKTLVVLGTKLPAKQKQRFIETGAELLELPSDEGVIDLVDLMKVLGERQITSVLVEAGGILLGSLFDSGLVDKVVAFLAPMIIGGEEARPAVAGKGFSRLTDCAKLKQLKVDRVGEDVFISGYVIK
jgi:diaminohydroxyphosphoribosylaminopyrimidine deaminase / 5-amino-6-(5-phosphoribosylamino)uracil reductase